MKNLFLIALLFASTSCSSAEWKRVTVNPEIWNGCRREFDGPELAGKGWCHSYVEVKKKIFGKDEERVGRDFCAFADEACIKSHNLHLMYLTPEDPY